MAIAVLDVLIVAFVIFRMIKLVRGTRAWKILIGIGVFVLALWLSDMMQLKTLHWMLEKAAILAPVALVILLLPELRKALEGVARLGLLPERFLGGETERSQGVLGEIASASGRMARERIGALIVIERSESLADVARSGVELNAQVTADLLTTIFYHGSPLHDGAAIINDENLVAAACRLPSSESQTIDPQYHMRHRAGIGVSEQFDSVTVIVSEERGSISVAVRGRLTELNDEEELLEQLEELLGGQSSEAGLFGLRKRDREEVTSEAK